MGGTRNGGHLAEGGSEELERKTVYLGGELVREGDLVSTFDRVGVGDIVVDKTRRVECRGGGKSWGQGERRRACITWITAWCGCVCWGVGGAVGKCESWGSGGEPVHISFNLGHPATVKLFIFTLTGKLVFSTTTSGG